MIQRRGTKEAKIEGNKTSNLPLLPEVKKAQTLAAMGKSYRAIGREIGRDHKTVKSWLSKPEAQKEVAELKLEIADLYEGLSKKILESINDDVIKESKLRDRVISAGVCTDKSNLLRQGGMASPGALFVKIVALACEKYKPKKVAEVDVLELESKPNHEPVDGCNLSH